MEQAKSDLQRLQELFDKQVQELKDTNKKQAKTAKVSEQPSTLLHIAYLRNVTLSFLVLLLMLGCGEYGER